MTTMSGGVTVWAPRVAGLALALFLSMFALDAFDGRSLADAVPAFLIHLAPALLVGATVAIAWRYPLAGAAGFLAFAAGYAVMVRGRLDWIAVISGPLAVVAALYVLSWRASGGVSSHGR